MVGPIPCLAFDNRLIVVIDGNLVFHFPSSNFHTSVDVNSHQGIEPHSLETSIGLESINLSVDLVQELVSRLKSRTPAKPKTLPTPSPRASPFSASTPSFFPTSPSIQFMVGDGIFVEFFHSHPPQQLRRGSTATRDPEKTLLEVSTPPPLHV